METQPQSGEGIAFGPFEIHSGEVFKGGTRIRLAGQPFRILLVLLANRGLIVTREQLRAEVWTDGTFVDFDGGLNAAINKLRRSLNDSADNPRYIETVPGQGYRFIGVVRDLETGAPAFDPPPESPQELPAAVRPGRGRWWLAAAVVCTLAVASAWRFRVSGAETPAWKLTRLTNETGLSTWPALSPDGKLLAYSADQGQDQAGDLFVRQTSGGEAIRLTSDGARNISPDFSPDGSKIVFGSNRDGGGIYEISAFGGPTRLVAHPGWQPKFSPDGSQIAYWTGVPSVSAFVPGSGAVWVVPAQGGQPRQIGVEFTSARNPIWSADGKYLLLTGYTSPKAYVTSAIDWWLVPVKGGAAIRTGAYQALLSAVTPSTVLVSTNAAQRMPDPGCWSVSENSVVFVITEGDSHNLWTIDISPETGTASRVRRLTAGAADENTPFCAASGARAFTNLETRREIWSLPFDLNRGIAKGVLGRLTEGPARREHPSLSSDGKWLAFASNQTGVPNIRMREVATGNESAVSASPFPQRFPVISAQGDKVAFSGAEKGSRTIYVAGSGGMPEKVCDGCFQATGWSRDEKSLLVFEGDPFQIDIVDTASHQRSTLLKDSAHSLVYGRYSPDNRWVSFTIRYSANHGRIAIAPANGPLPVPESKWIPIAETWSDDFAHWSPDGKTLYYASHRDGYNCLWGQRLAADSYLPSGEPFPVQHFHGRIGYWQGGWSIAGDRIALQLVEFNGNIWMMSHSTGH